MNASGVMSTQSLLTVEDAQQRLAVATAIATEAQRNLSRAREALDEALAAAAEGKALAKLAMDGNRPALVRLGEQVRALHPGIVGFWPRPIADDDTFFRGHMRDLGLVVDFAQDVSEDFLTELAAAMRQFIRIFDPHYSDPKSLRQGYARAITAGGTLFYKTSDKRPSIFASYVDTAEVTGTLVDLLRDVPSYAVLTALSDRSSATRPFAAYCS